MLTITYFINKLDRYHKQSFRSSAMKQLIAIAKRLKATATKVDDDYVINGSRYLDEKTESEVSAIIQKYFQRHLLPKYKYLAPNILAELRIEMRKVVVFDIKEFKSSTLSQTKSLQSQIVTCNIAPESYATSQTSSHTRYNTSCQFHIKLPRKLANKEVKSPVPQSDTTNETLTIGLQH